MDIQPGATATRHACNKMAARGAPTRRRCTPQWKNSTLSALTSRLLFAVALVLLTFNPTRPLLLIHWLADGFPSVQPLEAIAGCCW